MKLRKCISGGQTGADKTGLECAKALNLKTGGTAPKGYRTESGADPSLKDFGVVEDDVPNYQSRTRKNVRDAEATLWFGNVGSPGYWCTKQEADRLGRPFIINPSGDKMVEVASLYEVINVAGNRVSTNPRVVQQVRDAFAALNPIASTEQPLGDGTFNRS